MKSKTSIFLLIIILAAFLRFYHIQSIPPGLYSDEAMNGINAIIANQTSNYKIFYPENNGREGFFINYIAILFKIFGIEVWVIRLASAIIGILTIIGFYLLAKELFSLNFALMSSFLMATSFWHLNFFRIGFRAIMVPFVICFALYFFINGLKSNKWRSFILSGVFFGLGFHTYIAYRFTPFIFLIALILFCIYNKPNAKKLFKSLIIMAIITIIITLPIALYFIKHPQDFIGRSTQVSVFNGDFIKNISNSILKTALMFNIYGDNNWRHNLSGMPALPLILSLFFIIGIIIAMKKRGFNELLTLSGFIIMLIPSILTNEGLPHFLRSIGAIPFVYILVTIGIFEFLKLDFIRRKKYAILLIISTICIYSLWLTGYNYFYVWANNQNTKDAFNQNYKDLGDFINGMALDETKYVITNDNGVLVNNIPMPAMTTKFITMSKKRNINYISLNQLESIKPPAYVIFLRNEKNDIDNFKKLFLNNKIKEFDLHNNYYQTKAFYIYKD